jgi:hypothetical protein
MDDRWWDPELGVARPRNDVPHGVEATAMSSAVAASIASASPPVSS